jgi:hypothetical protein
LTGFFCRKKDFWHTQSCRGENTNLAEFAQMRQKRMGIGAIKTSFGGIGPMCQKGTFVADSPDSGLVYPHKVGLPSHICHGNFGEGCWAAFHSVGLASTLGCSLGYRCFTRSQASVLICLPVSSAAFSPALRR